jgi:hypothetical protein
MAAFSIPDPRLTPGAAVLASKQAVCSQRNVKNKAVTVAMRDRCSKHMESLTPRHRPTKWIIW